jgi:hypothetical protein
MLPKLRFEPAAQIIDDGRGSPTAGIGAFPSATHHGGQALGTRTFEFPAIADRRLLHVIDLDETDACAAIRSGEHGGEGARWERGINT